MSQAKPFQANGASHNNFGQLFKKLIDCNVCSAEELAALRLLQAQLGSPIDHDVQTKSPVLLSERDYFKPKEAASYLSSSTSTLAKRRLYGGGPKFCRIGRAIRYAKSDLDAFMAATRVSSTTEKVPQ